MDAKHCVLVLCTILHGPMSAIIYIWFCYRHNALTTPTVVQCIHNIFHTEENFGCKKLLANGLFLQIWQKKLWSFCEFGRKKKFDILDSLQKKLAFYHTNASMCQRSMRWRHGTIKMCAVRVETSSVKQLHVTIWRWTLP